MAILILTSIPILCKWTINLAWESETYYFYLRADHNYKYLGFYIDVFLLINKCSYWFIFVDYSLSGHTCTHIAVSLFINDCPMGHWLFLFILLTRPTIQI